ncbi:MAG: hypothetical protein Q9165_002787 [Trypethelium subeluteriae]
MQLDLKESTGDHANLNKSSYAERIEENASVAELPEVGHETTQENNASSEEPLAKKGKYLSDLEAEEAFKNFYLRKVTEELAEDLDKARSASDFSERSLPILIEALQQGVGTFTKEERIRIGRADAEINA